MSGRMQVRGAGNGEHADTPPPDGPTRLVPMRVGDAEVYVEAVGDPAAIVPRKGFREVGLDPTEAFEKASDALRECVRVVGQRLADLGDAVTPDEVGVEFTLSFDVEGKANIVPVLITGKAKTAVGVKVSALWRPGGGETQAGTEAGTATR